MVEVCEGKIWPGSWKGHIHSWNSKFINDTKYFLFIKYEDMLKDPNIYIEKIADFLGVDICDHDRKRIIFNTSVKQMKKKEKAGGFPWLKKKKFKFINKAKSNLGIKKLPKDAVEYINRMNWDEMHRFGYIDF